MFDKINYRYPNSKEPLKEYNNNISINGKIFYIIILIYLYQINFLIYIFKDPTSIITPIITPITSPNKMKLDLITVHLKKKSPYKSNIQVTKKMTFQDLIKFVFPTNPPEGKRFVIKSSLDTNGKVFLSEQIIEEVFSESHIHLWINIEKITVDFDELFGDE
jgi:hypothetical protein